MGAIFRQTFPTMKHILSLCLLVLLVHGAASQVDGSEFCGEGTYFNEITQLCEVSPLVADFDMSGCVDIPDLLQFLVFFGECEFQPEWSCGSPVSFDGYAYATVQIGDQCWFAENLRSTHFANGDAIETGLTQEQWQDDFIPAYNDPVASTDECFGQFCDNDSVLSLFGLYYNSPAMYDDRNICPVGWHVPDLDELWPIMDQDPWGDPHYLRVSDLWGCDVEGSNELGFNALPSGIFGIFNGSGPQWKWYTTMNGGSGAILGYKSTSWTGLETTDSFWIMCNWGGPEGISAQQAYSIRCLKD